MTRSEPASAAPASTGPASAELTSTGPAGTGPASTGLTSTGPASTGPASTRAATTGPASTRAATTGPASTRAATTGPASPPASRPADRRAAIVAAAYDCLAAKGFEGLRMRDIAAAAGINIATVHYYFPSKEDVIAGVVNYAHEQFRSAAWPAGAPDEPPRPRQHITAVFDLLTERPALGQVLSEISLRAGRDPAIAAITRRAEDDWLRALAAVLAPREDAEALAVTLSLAIKGACLPTSSVRDLRLARDELLRYLDREPPRLDREPPG